MTDNSYVEKTCDRLRSFQEAMIPENERDESYARRDDSGDLISYAKPVAIPEKIKENAEELLTTIQQLKPNTAKGIYIKSISLSSTMGKNIRIDKDTVLKE